MISTTVLVFNSRNAIQDADLIITQRLLAVPVELKERLELRLLVCVPFISTEDVVEKLGYRPGNGS